MSETRDKLVDLYHQRAEIEDQIKEIQKNSTVIAVDYTKLMNHTIFYQHKEACIYGNVTMLVSLLKNALRRYYRDYPMVEKEPFSVTIKENPDEIKKLYLKNIFLDEVYDKPIDTLVPMADDLVYDWLELRGEE